MKPIQDKQTRSIGVLEGQMTGAGKGRRILAYGVLAISLAVTFFGWYSLKRNLDREARLKFDFDCKYVQARIAQQIENYTDMLRGAQGLFAASQNVSFSEWSAYAQKLPLSRKYSGVTAVEYVEKVDIKDLGTFADAVRNDTSLDPAGYPYFKVHPEPKKSPCFIVRYLEPLEGNSKLFGFDLGSENTRRSVLDEAMKTGRLVISDKVDLIRYKTRRSGFIIALPVYRNGASLLNTEDRKANLNGFVVASVRTHNLFSKIFEEFSHQSTIDYEVFSGRTMDQEHLLYDHDRSLHAVDAKYKARFKADVPVKVEGSVFIVHCTAPATYGLGAQRENYPMLVLIGGVAISVLFFFLVRTVASSEMRAKNYADKMTKDLREEIIRRQKNEVEAEKRRQERMSLLAEIEAQKKALDQFAIISETDLGGNIIYANENFCKISKYSEKELIGQNHRIVNSGFHPKSFFKDMWTTIGSGRVWHDEIQNRAKDGELYWVDMTIVPLLSAPGRPAKYIAFRFLITDRKKAEEALQKLNSFQESVLGGAGSSVIATTEEGVITHFNPAAEKMLGYAAAEMIGLQTPKIFHDKDEVVARAAEFSAELGERIEPGFEVFAAKARRNLPNIYEWTYIRKDGTRLAVLLSVTALRDGRGNIFGFVGIATDMTDRKQMEAKVADAVAVKGEFISMVSHELRTPLTVIKEGIGLVADGTLGTLNTDQSDYLNLAQRNTDRLARLINDVLDYQKLDAGQMVMKTALYDLNGVIRENLPTFASLAVQRGLTVKTELSQEILPLHFDKDKIIQVLMNFVGNAIKFTERGHVTIRTSREGNAVHVAVVDNGIGIKEEDQHKLFTSFSQIHDSGIHKTGGTGLGLAISKKIIEMHRGRIGVDSVWGHGATFYFTLPIVERRK